MREHATGNRRPTDVMPMVLEAWGACTVRASALKREERVMIKVDEKWLCRVE